MDTSYIGFLTAMAVLVEAITNILKTGIPTIPSRYHPALAALVGGLMAALGHAGLFDRAGIHFPPFVDYILTGIILSRGAGVFHNLSDYLNPGGKDASLFEERRRQGR